MSILQLIQKRIQKADPKFTKEKITTLSLGKFTKAEPRSFTS